MLGASGQIGRFVVQQLDQTPGEVHVRVAARTPEQCLALQHEGPDAVLLDLDQPNTFAATLRGVDRAFLLTGYTFTWASSDGGIAQIHTSSGTNS